MENGTKSTKSCIFAEPSGLNADCIRTLLSKMIFEEVAADFRDTLSYLAKKMAIEECQHKEANNTRRLIPLDKNPGVRPIIRVEIFPRILGKSIMVVTKENKQMTIGNLEVCVGH